MAVMELMASAACQARMALMACQVETEWTALQVSTVPRGETGQMVRQGAARRT
jgi:hypothetical protein